MSLAKSFHSMASSIPPSVQGGCLASSGGLGRLHPRYTPSPPDANVVKLSFVSALHPCYRISRVRPYTRSDRPDLLCIVLFFRPLFSLTHRLIAESRHPCGLPFSLLHFAHHHRRVALASSPRPGGTKPTTSIRFRAGPASLRPRSLHHTCYPVPIRDRAERLGEPGKGS